MGLDAGQAAGLWAEVPAGGRRGRAPAAPDRAGCLGDPPPTASVTPPKLLDAERRRDKGTRQGVERERTAAACLLW